MRRFLILAHRVPTGGAFTLNDLAGGAGRMDELARAVSTAFTLSNDLRRDTEVTLLFVAEPPPRARRIDLAGGRLRFLNPDERSTAALLKNALVRSVDFPRPFESSPGLTVAPAEPTQVVREFLAQPNPVWLSEGGQRIEEWSSPGGHIAAVVSDPYDPTPEERDLLVSIEVPRVSVSPRSLRTSQVIDLVHHELDLRDAARAPNPGPTA
ncbi:MAG TPA: tRNA (pseudouridine(54)-N(1))-methyltransferase TrmY [Thermoplasmata archaeon]|jgi:tRNA (pseudouridine54-N1)-methyltransferase|nr:tRNA (pseudouridine(54)-N(1))-methyltransferase TrmY [Thermoplasmata archaeon]